MLRHVVTWGFRHVWCSGVEHVHAIASNSGQSPLDRPMSRQERTAQRVSGTLDSSYMAIGKPGTLDSSYMASLGKPGTLDSSCMASLGKLDKHRLPQTHERNDAKSAVECELCVPANQQILQGAGE